MIVRLATVLSTAEYTMGRLYLPDDKGTVLHTLEDAWIPTTEHHGGTNGISCIPRVSYRMVPHNSGIYGKTWVLVHEAVDVYDYPAERPNGKGRFGCLIHAGNHAGHTEGCILVGVDSSDGWLHRSKNAMKILRAALPWEEHELQITQGN